MGDTLACPTSLAPATCAVSVHSGTASAVARLHTRCMKPEYAKAAVLGLWVVAVYMMAVSANVSSVTYWLALASLVIVPPILARRFWRAPAPTMSESIRESIQ